MFIMTTMDKKVKDVRLEKELWKGITVPSLLRRIIYKLHRKFYMSGLFVSYCFLRQKQPYWLKKVLNFMIGSFGIGCWIR